MMLGNVVLIIFVTGNSIIVAKDHHRYHYFNLITMVYFHGNFYMYKKIKPNALICEFCYNDTPDENDNYLYISVLLFNTYELYNCFLLYCCLYLNKMLNN